VDGTCDDGGRMTSRPAPSGGTQTLAWDVLSNLTSVTPTSRAATTYLCDASGQRFAAISGTSATVYMGAWEATDPNTTDGSDADVTVTRFYSAGGVQLASKTTGGSTLITLGDVQGSAQVTVDASGQVARNAYTPYGVKRAGSNVASAHGWLNQIADADTGLTYLNARYYDPQLGRFLSPDPLMNPGDPRTLDPYRYADNNPVVYIDATGLSPCNAMGALAMGLLGFGCGGNHQGANNTGQFFGGVSEGTRGYVDDTRRAVSAEGAQAVVSDIAKYGSATSTVWAVEGFTSNAMHLDRASEALVAYQTYGDARSLRQAGYYSTQPAIDGMIAYSSTLVAGMGSAGVGAVGASARGLTRSATKATLADPAGGFNSFSAAKRALGHPGPGMVYDHVVEQSQMSPTRSGFSARQIHHPDNLYPVSARVNQIKANYYSSVQPFTNNLTVRNWLNGQSFQAQHAFGMSVHQQIRSGKIQ